MLQPNAFQEIVTEDASWFQCVYISDVMIGSSRDLAATRTKDADRTKKSIGDAKSNGPPSDFGSSTESKDL
jgi:hypothetical protein